jgi:hypothetical protein
MHCPKNHVPQKPVAGRKDEPVFCIVFHAANLTYNLAKGKAYTQILISQNDKQFGFSTNSKGLRQNHFRGILLCVSPCTSFRRFAD